MKKMEVTGSVCKIVTFVYANMMAMPEHLYKK